MTKSINPKYIINDENRKQIIKETIEREIKRENNKKDKTKKININEYIKNVNNENRNILNNIQIVILIDISGSMINGDNDFENNNKCNRYDNVIKSVNQIIDDIFKYDKDKNVPVYFFDDKVKHLKIINPKDFIQKCIEYKPKEQKRKKMYDAIEMAFKNEIDDTDNILFIVFTDGYVEMNESKKIKELIKIKLCERDPTGTKLNILFIRIGDESKAKDFLNEIDNNKEIGKNVDTKSDNTLYKMGNEIAILNAIYEKLDNIYQKYDNTK